MPWPNQLFDKATASAGNALLTLEALRSVTGGTNALGLAHVGSCCIAPLRKIYAAFYELPGMADAGLHLVGRIGLLESELKILFERGEFTADDLRETVDWEDTHTAWETIMTELICEAGKKVWPRDVSSYSLEQDPVARVAMVVVLLDQLSGDIRELHRAVLRGME